MEAVLSHFCSTDFTLPDRPSFPSAAPKDQAQGMRDDDPPGILILSQDGRTRYFNNAAQKFLAILGDKPISPKSAKKMQLQKIISALLLELKHGKEFSDTPSLHRVFLHQETFYRVRSIPLASPGKSRRDTYLLLSIERSNRNLRIDSFNLPARLTEREKTLVMLLSEGRTNKDVARCMGISEYTVKEHIQRIMRKLKVTTRVGIVATLLRTQRPQKL